jgi:hypothetical protein
MMNLKIEIVFNFFNHLFGGWYQWKGKHIRKGLRRLNVMEILVLMYENGKMRLETTSPMGEKYHEVLAFLCLTYSLNITIPSFIHVVINDKILCILWLNSTTFS